MTFRVAGVALRDIPTCFITCPKSFCVTDAILFRGFQKLSWIFRGRRSPAQHFRRVASRVFLEYRIVRLRQLVAKCKMRGRRGIFKCIL